MVALIGANGAGKTSTPRRRLARMLDAAGGSVRYQGKEISAVCLRTIWCARALPWRRKGVAFSPA